MPLSLTLQQYTLSQWIKQAGSLCKRQLYLWTCLQST